MIEDNARLAHKTPSAYVSELIMKQEHLRRGLAAVAEWEAEHGAFTARRSRGPTVSSTRRRRRTPTGSSTWSPCLNRSGATTRDAPRVRRGRPDRRGAGPITVLADARTGDGARCGTDRAGDRARPGTQESGRRGLARLLEGCRVAGLDRESAELVGDLLGMAGRNDVVDAHVVVCCLLFGGTCVTSDDGDIRHLAEAARSDRQHRFGRTRLPIIPI